MYAKPPFWFLFYPRNYQLAFFPWSIPVLLLICASDFLEHAFKWVSCLLTSYLLFTAWILGCSRSICVLIVVCVYGFMLCAVKGNESRCLPFGWFLAVAPLASLLCNPLPWRTASCHSYPFTTEMGALGPAEQAVMKAVWGSDCKKICKLSFPSINNPYCCRIQICWTPVLMSNAFHCTTAILHFFFLKKWAWY